MPAFTILVHTPLSTWVREQSHQPREHASLHHPGVYPTLPLYLPGSGSKATSLRSMPAFTIMACTPLYHIIYLGLGGEPPASGACQPLPSWSASRCFPLYTWVWEQSHQPKEHACLHHPSIHPAFPLSTWVGSRATSLGSMPAFTILVRTPLSTWVREQSHQPREHASLHRFGIVECREFFLRESLAAGSFDQLPAPLECILADA
jgi:hypothetical protein